MKRPRSPSGEKKRPLTSRARYHKGLNDALAASFVAHDLDYDNENELLVPGAYEFTVDEGDLVFEKGPGDTALDDDDRAEVAQWALEILNVEGHLLDVCGDCGFGDAFREMTSNHALDIRIHVNATRKRAKVTSAACKVIDWDKFEQLMHEWTDDGYEETLALMSHHSKCPSISSDVAEQEAE